MKSSVQDCLFYILKAPGLCATSLAYPNNYVLALKPPPIFYMV